MEEQNNKLQSEGQNAASPETKSSVTHSAVGALLQEEEKLYWKQDLFFKKASLFVSGGGFLLIILGLLANLWQVSINTKQLQLNTAQSELVAKSIRLNGGNVVTNHVTNLDQVFMQKPYLIPYFYGNKPIDEKDEKYPEVSATALLVLDVFDLTATQNRHYPEFWDTPEAWDEWMIDVFSTSPILGDTIDKYPNWYGKSLKELRRKGQARLEARAASQAKP